MKRSQTGFTLLEAIVALVILSTSGLAVYSWLGTSFDGLSRVNKTVEINQLSYDLDAYFRGRNLTSETDNIFRMNGYDIDWQARLLEPKSIGKHPTGIPGKWILGLYQIDVSIRKAQQEVGAYQTRVVGIERYRRGPR